LRVVDGGDAVGIGVADRVEVTAASGDPGLQNARQLVGVVEIARPDRVDEVLFGVGAG
jgi:hypothetical protein